MNRFFPVVILIVFLACLSLFAQDSTKNISKFQYLSPVPASNLQMPETNIIIRFGEAYSDVKLSDTSLIHVTGSLSGNHTGKLYLTGDSRTLVFTPDTIFTYGEKVYVQMSDSLKTISNTVVDTLNFYFYVSKGPSAYLTPNSNFSGTGSMDKTTTKINQVQSVADSSLLFPSGFPEVYIGTPSQATGNYFLALNQTTSNYLTIINNSGIPLYSKKMPSTIYDFKIQPSGLLTYFDQTGQKFYGMNDKFEVVDSFYCKNGYTTDFHELQVLPNGHSFLQSFDDQPVNMDTVVDGANDSMRVRGGIIQELDENKVVIWQWRTWDHYKITDDIFSSGDFFQGSHGTIEYCHPNSIDVVDDNRIIISARHLYEITAIDRNTGNIIWRLGGKNNQFNITGNNTNFVLQHDARLIDNNRLTIFDNGNSGVDFARALIYEINESVSPPTAVLRNEIHHLPDVRSKNMGNLQYTDNHHFVIGWGNTGSPGKDAFYMTELDSAFENVLSNDSLKSTGFIYSYRAFKFPWKTKIITSDKDSILFTGNGVTGKFLDSVKVKNNSNSPLDINGVFYKNDSLSITDSFPITLQPGGDTVIHFELLHSDTSKVMDTVYIAAKWSDAMAALPVILVIDNTTTPVENAGFTLPTKFNLEQNYPNPFNPSTSIEFSLPSEQFVTLTVYDILGRIVKTLINEEKPAGSYHVIFNSQNFSNGVYFYKLSAGNYTNVKKMILLK